MPEEDLASALLKTAKELAGPSKTDASLRRAVSTQYYAIFHALAKLCADALVGNDESARPNKAWVEVYRGLGHGPTKDSCKGANKIAFPDALQDFSNTFVQLQEARERADYDPTYTLENSTVEAFHSLAEKAISTLDAVGENDRKAYAAWVLITTRGAQQARKLAKTND